MDWRRLAPPKYAQTPPNQETSSCGAANRHSFEPQIPGANRRYGYDRNRRHAP